MQTIYDKQFKPYCNQMRSNEFLGGSDEDKCLFLIFANHAGIIVDNNVIDTVIVYFLSSQSISCT